MSCCGGGLNRIIRSLQKQINDCCAGSTPTPPSSSPQFEPARVLFVAQSWPVGVDPLFYFTSINAAIAQAVTLTPEAGNPVNILIAPGFYPEHVVLPADTGFINLSSLAGNLDYVGGSDSTVDFRSLTYTPSQNGVCNVSGIEIETVTFTGTGGAAFNSGIMVLNNCVVDGDVTLSSEAALFCINTNIQGAVNTATGAHYYQFGGYILRNSTMDASNITLQSVDVLGNISLTSTSTLNDADTAGAGLSGPCVGNIFHGSLTVDATSTADIRGSQYTTLAGAGKINRSYDTAAFSSSNATGSTVTFASLGKVDYITAPDELTFMQQSGTPGVVLFPTIAATGFTQTDTTTRVGVLGIHQK